MVPHLVVDLEFLHHSQLHEHPQSGRDHGVDVQREVVEGELIDAQLADQGDVGSLFHRGGKKNVEEERVTLESKVRERGAIFR